MVRGLLPSVLYEVGVGLYEEMYHSSVLPSWWSVRERETATTGLRCSEIWDKYTYKCESRSMEHIEARGTLTVGDKYPHHSETPIFWSSLQSWLGFFKVRL